MTAHDAHASSSRVVTHRARPRAWHMGDVMADDMCGCHVCMMTRARWHARCHVTSATGRSIFGASVGVRERGGASEWEPQGTARALSSRGALHSHTSSHTSPHTSSHVIITTQRSRGAPHSHAHMPRRMSSSHPCHPSHTHTPTPTPPYLSPERYGALAACRHHIRVIHHPHTHPHPHPHISIARKVRRSRGAPRGAPHPERPPPPRL